MEKQYDIYRIGGKTMVAFLLSPYKWGRGPAITVRCKRICLDTRYQLRCYIESPNLHINTVMMTSRRMHPHI